MKKFISLLALALMLATALVAHSVITPKPAHAASSGGNCQVHNAIHWIEDSGSNLDAGWSYEPPRGKPDVWPCLWYQGTNVQVSTSASFYEPAQYTALLIPVIPICKMTINLLNQYNQVLESHVYSCDTAYTWKLTGVQFGNGQADVNGDTSFTWSGHGNYWVTANVNLWYYDGYRLHLETGNQGTPLYTL